MPASQQICFDFLKGNCQRKNCKYSHDITLAKDIPFCRDFQNGHCNRENCLYPHVKARRKRGRWGDNCSWEEDIHSSSASTTSLRTASSTNNPPLCRDFLKGACTRGTCRYSHDTSRKRRRTDDRWALHGRGDDIITPSSIQGVSSGAASIPHTVGPPVVSPTIAAVHTATSPPSTMVSHQQQVPTTQSRKASSDPLAQRFEEFIAAKPKLTVPVRNTQEAPQGQPMRIGNLPNDVLRYMSDFLAPKDMVQLSLTCTMAYQLYTKRVICFIIDNTTSMTRKDRFRQQYEVAKMFLEGLATTAQVVLKLVKAPMAVNAQYSQTFAAFDGNRPRTSTEALQLLDKYLSSPLPTVFYSATITPLITCISEAVNRGFTQIVCLTDGEDNECQSLDSVVVCGQVVSSIITEHNQALDATSPMRIHEANGRLAAFLQAMASRHGKDLIFPTIVGIGKEVIKECLPGFEALHVPQGATIEAMRTVANRARLLTVTKESGGGAGSRRLKDLADIRQRMDQKKRQLKSKYTANSLAVFHQVLDMQQEVIEEGEILSEWDTGVREDEKEESGGTHMDVDQDDDIAPTTAHGDVEPVTAVEDTTTVVESGLAVPAQAPVPGTPPKAVRVRVLGDRLPTDRERLHPLSLWLVREVNMRMRDNHATYPGWTVRKDNENYMVWQAQHRVVADHELARTLTEAQRIWASMTEEEKTTILDAAATFFYRQKPRETKIWTQASVDDYRQYLQLLREGNAAAAEEMETRFMEAMPLLGLGCYFWVHHRDGNGETLHERLLRTAQAATVVAPTVVASSPTHSTTSVAEPPVVIVIDDDDEYNEATTSEDGNDNGDGMVPQDDAVAVAWTADTNDVPSTASNDGPVLVTDSTAKEDDPMVIDGESNHDDQDPVSDTALGMTTSCAAPAAPLLEEHANDVTEETVDFANDLPVLLPATTVPVISATSHEATEVSLDMDVDMADTEAISEANVSTEPVPLPPVEPHDTAVQSTPVHHEAVQAINHQTNADAPTPSHTVTINGEGIHLVTPVVHTSGTRNDSISLTPSREPQVIRFPYGYVTVHFDDAEIIGRDIQIDVRIDIRQKPHSEIASTFSSP